MEASKDSYKREYRDIAVKTTDGATLLGKVNIGIKDRVSDFFAKTDNPFVVIFDAEYRDASEKVFIVNTRNIVWVEPLD